MTLLAASDAVTTTLALPQILDPMYLLQETWLSSLVLPAILVIVFIETGLLFPLLPGDSLLFTGGMLAAQHVDSAPSIWVLVPAVTITAFLGDQCAYWIGRKGFGPALYHKEDGRFFKKKYVTESHEFFEKWGPAAIILARFVPIARTFVPVLAGVSAMEYRKFVSFDIIGAVLWAGGVTTLGYFLGNIEFIRKNIEAIFLLIVFISVIPGIISVAKSLLNGRSEATQAGAPTESTAAPSRTNTR